MSSLFVQEVHTDEFGSVNVTVGGQFFQQRERERFQIKFPGTLKWLGFGIWKEVREKENKREREREEEQERDREREVEGKKGDKSKSQVACQLTWSE